jgi:cysteinyl-tRNA synthetase
VLLRSTRYRSPIHFGEEPLGECARVTEAFEPLFARTQRVTGRAFYELSCRDQRAGAAAGGEVKALRERFLTAMDDDFNTATASLFDYVRVVNTFIHQHALESKKPAAELAVLDAMPLTLLELTGGGCRAGRPPRRHRLGTRVGRVNGPPTASCGLWRRQHPLD